MSTDPRVCATAMWPAGSVWILVTPAAPGDRAACATRRDDSRRRRQPGEPAVVVRTLEGRGYRILAAKNGRAALDIARRVAAGSDPARRHDAGARRLRGLPRAQGRPGDARRDRRVPLGARRSHRQGHRASSSAPSDYITKPIQPEEVIARVANHVARQQLEREVRRSRDRLERELASAGAMQRRILPPALPSGTRRHVRRLLPDEPLRRRRLLRRLSAARRAVRRDRGRRLGPRRAVGDRDGDDSRRGARVSRLRLRSGRDAALPQPAFRVPVGVADVRDRALRADRSARAQRDDCLRRPSAAAPAPRRQGHRHCPSRRRCRC